MMTLFLVQHGKAKPETWTDFSDSIAQEVD